MWLQILVRWTSLWAIFDGASQGWFLRRNQSREHTRDLRIDKRIFTRIDSKDSASIRGFAYRTPSNRGNSRIYSSTRGSNTINHSNWTNLSCKPCSKFEWSITLNRFSKRICKNSFQKSHYGWVQIADGQIPIQVAKVPILRWFIRCSWLLRYVMRCWLLPTSRHHDLSSIDFLHVCFPRLQLC